MKPSVKRWWKTSNQVRLLVSNHRNSQYFSFLSVIVFQFYASISAL